MLRAVQLSSQKHPLQAIDSVMFTASRLNTFTSDKRFSSSFGSAMFLCFVLSSLVVVVSIATLYVVD